MPPEAAPETPLIERGTEMNRDQAVAAIAGITGSQPEAEPVQETAEEQEVVVEDHEELDAAEDPEGEPEGELEGEDDAEALDAEPEDEGEAAEDAKTYEVKVNGETSQVSLEELRNGYQRHQDYQQKMSDLGTRQQQLDEIANHAETSISERLQQADMLLAEVAKAAGYGAEPDWGELRATLDPEDYRFRRDEWEDNQRNLQRLGAERQKLVEAQTQEQEQRFHAYVQGEVEKIRSSWPEFADESTRAAAMDGMFGYLETEGFSRQESANLIDHRQISLIRKAMAYDKIQAAKPQTAKKVRKAPQMAAPSKRVRRPKDQSFRASLDKAKQTGSRDDFIAAIGAWRSQK